MPGMFDRDSWIYQHPGPVIGATFSGNEPLAKAYWGTAMGMLGSVKSIMRESLLGTSSSSMTMEDGTEIVVESNYGKDKIWINSPVVEPGVEVAQKELRFKLTDQNGNIISNADSVAVVFEILRPNHDPDDPSLEISTEYPRQIFDEESGYWTLRRKNINPFLGTWDPGFPEPAESIAWTLNDEGEMYEIDDEFWVHYHVSYIQKISIDHIPVIAESETTEYKGIVQPFGEESVLYKTENLISPDDYEDIVNIIPVPVIPQPPGAKAWIYYFELYNGDGVISDVFPRSPDGQFEYIPFVCASWIPQGGINGWIPSVTWPLPPYDVILQQNQLVALAEFYDSNGLADWFAWPSSRHDRGNSLLGLFFYNRAKKVWVAFLLHKVSSLTFGEPNDEGSVYQLPDLGDEGGIYPDTIQIILPSSPLY